MFVKPAPGRAVRDPDSRLLLPSGGADVEETSFWLRRLRDGDVLTKEDVERAEAEAVAQAAKPPMEPPAIEHSPDAHADATPVADHHDAVEEH